MIMRQRKPTSVVSSTSFSSVDVSDTDDNITTTNYDETSSKPFIESNHLEEHQWDKLYDSPPIISRNTFLFMGIVLYIIAKIWTPGIIIFFYIASIFFPYAFRQNDNAVERRKLFKLFMKHPKHSDRLRNIQNYVHLQEKYWENSRGMLLYTSIMSPKDDQPITTVACYCHGYTDHSSFVKRLEYQRLVQAGIALVSIEYEGHGRSDGPLGLIPCFDQLVMDVTTFFRETLTSASILKDKPAFLMGESMGGAVVYNVYNQVADLFKGVVFICPMCKLNDKMLPPKFITDSIRPIVGPSGTVSTLGYLPIAPSKKIEHLSFRVPELGTHVRTSPTCFSGRKPRLATARECLEATKKVSESLSHFNAPFIIVHGKQDKVTDPLLSQLLYDEAISTDKTIKLYDHLWHALTSSETKENIDLVCNDIIQWILQRAT